MIPRPYRVSRMRREMPGVKTLHLAPEDGTPAPAFTPGQFNMLYVFGSGEVAISIAGRDSGGRSLLHTVRAAGAVSSALCKMKRGSVVGVRGPFGSAWPLSEIAGKDILLIAGGLGLPPLWGNLSAILANRQNFGRIALLVGARAPDLILYQKELERLRVRPDLDVYITVDRAGPGWRGHVGLVTSLIPSLRFPLFNAVAMICGPEPMMRFTARELQRCGMRQESIFLSLERNMKCAIALCGHCQFGPSFVCRDGPVFRQDRIRDWLLIPEL